MIGPMQLDVPGRQNIEATTHLCPDRQMQTTDMPGQKRQNDFAIYTHLKSPSIALVLDQLQLGCEHKREAG